VDNFYKKIAEHSLQSMHSYTAINYCIYQDPAHWRMAITPGTRTVRGRLLPANDVRCCRLRQSF